jgi:tetratricopeptide (TPR) repeat protein
VLPLLEFVNKYEIPLEYEKGGKHVWFLWDRQKHDRNDASTAQASIAASADKRMGSYHYNPLVMQTDSEAASQALASAAELFGAFRFAEAQKVLGDFLEQEENGEVCLAIAFTLARTGKPEQALSMCRRANKVNPSEKSRRLTYDLERMLGHHGQAPLTGKDGLTIFAMPKAFEGRTDVIQRNAIRSWRKLGADVEIILFGDDPGVAEMAQEVGARHVPAVAQNEFGTPLLNDFFCQAAKLARNDYLAYVNADILLFDDFLAAFKTVRSKLNTFLLIGTRWDLDVVEELEQDNPLLKEKLMQAVRKDGIRHAETGLDYFIHSKNLWKVIPPFALGRCAFDNWLVMPPNKAGENVVDCSEFITAIHQEHDYGHLAGRRNEAFLGVETWRNRALCGHVDDFGLACSTRLKLSSEGYIEERTPQKPMYNAPQVLQARKEWLQRQAQRFMNMGHMDIARHKHEEVLYIDPENSASKAFMEQSGQCCDSQG